MLRCQESNKLPWYWKIFPFTLHIFISEDKNFVKKINLINHGGLINFRGSIMIQGMAKFQATLQQKQPTKDVLKKLFQGTLPAGKADLQERKKFWSAGKRTCSIGKLLFSMTRKFFKYSYFLEHLSVAASLTRIFSKMVNARNL